MHKRHQWFRNLGPSLITAALVFGPGSLTVTTKLGAGFQYHLLWLIVLSVGFMVVYTKLSAHLGLVLEGSLMGEVRGTYGRVAAIFLGLGIFCISASFQAGNSIGAGISLTELFGQTPTLWIILIALSGIALLFFKSFYQILEKIMIGLVLVMLICFFLTLLLSAPSMLDILKGLVPRVPEGSELLGIALVASSFSIVGAFYQSSLVQEKGWKLVDLAKAKQESRIGIVTLGCLSSLVMICAGSVLFQSGIEVNTAADLGKALEPLFGRFSSTAFMIGFLAASYSSLIGNATIGGGLLADSLSLGHQLSDRRVRVMIVIIIVIGAAVAIRYGSLPLELIIFAQAMTILIAPAAAIFLLLIARKKKLFSLESSPRLTIILWAGLLLLIILAIYNFYRIFLS